MEVINKYSVEMLSFLFIKECVSAINLFINHVFSSIICTTAVLPSEQTNDDCYDQQETNHRGTKDQNDLCFSHTRVYRRRVVGRVGVRRIVIDGRVGRWLNRGCWLSQGVGLAADRCQWQAVVSRCESHCVVCNCAFSVVVELDEVLL